VTFGLISFGFVELAVIAVLVIVVVGPDRMPEMMRYVGKQYGRLRRASDELRRAFQLEVDRVDADRRAVEIRTRREELLAERKKAREEAKDQGKEPEGPVARQVGLTPLTAEEDAPTDESEAAEEPASEETS